MFNSITITGADDLTNPTDLNDLNFAWVEWGILFSPARAGTARYPKKGWREKLYEFPNLRLSAHLCGLAVEDFLNSEEELLAELSHYQRIQLNVRFDKNPEYIREICAIFLDKPIIIQHNRANEDAFKNFHYSEYHLLFDSSGGRGTTPALWKPAYPKYYCGYAGGLSPDNLHDEAARIEEVNEQPWKGWLDLESGARTDNKFDLHKVERLIRSAEEIINWADQAN